MFCNNVLRQTDNAQFLLKHKMHTQENNPENYRNNITSEDQLFLLMSLLSIYANLKKEVEANNKIISELLNKNMRQNLQSITQDKLFDINSNFK